MLTSIKNSRLSGLKPRYFNSKMTGAQTSTCDLVPFLRAKKANVPTLGPRFLVKFPRVGKAIEVKCPKYARGPPPPPPTSGLTLIDALWRHKARSKLMTTVPRFPAKMTLVPARAVFLYWKKFVLVFVLVHL